MRFTYSQQHLDFLRKNYPLLSLDALTMQFNLKFNLQKTDSQIRAATKNNGILCGRKPGTLKIKQKLFSDEMINFARHEYVNISREQLTALINNKFGSNYSVMQVLGLCKREKFSSGLTGHFKSGQMPWNTGTKGVMKPNSGTFKKGQKPPNQKEFGHERICPKDGYVLMKIDQMNPHTGHRGLYVHKHKLTWEKAFGKVPEGKVVSLIDGNPLNCDDIKNLELLDRATLCRINHDQVSSAPIELRPTMRTLAKLKSKMHLFQKSI